MRARLREAFRQTFGSDAHTVVRAPGRVNLIGEHTDYNDGFVLPMAIDRAVWIALRPRSDRQVRVRSLDLGGTGTFALDDLERGGEGWSEYLKGVAWSLREDGLPLRGWEGVVTGDVPVGAGLSSSAALELATARAFQAVSGFGWDAVRMAQLSQRAENDWVGMKCGIMDQLISAAGQAGHALLIDCRSLELTPVPLPRGTAVVVLDTSTRRGLVDSAYNERRRQCEEAARFFGVSALRDVTFEQFQAQAGRLSEVTRKRAQHVISENRRTLEAAEAMRRGDADRLGRLMNESHLSLRDDFEVSSEALDAMADCAQAIDGCYGARMTGAGFGGCAVALVAEEKAQTFVDHVTSCYQRSSGHTPSIYVCQATEGAAVVD
ncbi:MAG: galactokinase [Trueperaceae bacterium]|nr:MAG: galactokinase [Trueperaceae bacterium]